MPPSGIGGAYAPQRRPPLPTKLRSGKPGNHLALIGTPVCGAPSAPHVLDTLLDQRTPGEVADLLIARFRPALISGKKPKKMRWIFTCLTSQPTEETTPKYSDREACASLHVAVDILTHHDGIRHSGFEGYTSTTARALLVLIAYKLQHVLHNPPSDRTVDMGALSDLADNISFSEIRKRTLQSRFCAVLCDTTSDQDTLLNCGGIVLPIGHMFLYVTFAPSMIATLHNSLSKEVRIALRSHKALFYQGGLVLRDISSIASTPITLFQLALLTMLCLHRGDSVPTRTERPRLVSDVIADVTPQGNAP